jgi:hypothetical protein
MKKRRSRLEAREAARESAVGGAGREEEVSEQVVGLEMVGKSSAMLGKGDW